MQRMNLNDYIPTGVDFENKIGYVPKCIGNFNSSFVHINELFMYNAEYTLQAIEYNKLMQKMHDELLLMPLDARPMSTAYTIWPYSVNSCIQKRIVMKCDDGYEECTVVQRLIYQEDTFFRKEDSSWFHFIDLHYGRMIVNGVYSCNLE